jgi:hypothetical protein
MGLIATVEKQEQKQKPQQFAACNGIDWCQEKIRLP